MDKLDEEIYFDIQEYYEPNINQSCERVFKSLNLPQVDIEFAKFFDWLLTQNQSFQDISYITKLFDHAYIPVANYKISKKLTSLDYGRFLFLKDAVNRLGIESLIKTFNDLDATLPKRLKERLKKEIDLNGK
jgi:hypothetical protein